MRLIDADAFKEQLENAYEYTELSEVIEMLDNAPAVDIKPFANVTFDKDELEQIVRDKVIEPIKNGELVLKTEEVKTEERPHGEWLDIYSSHIAYKCSCCGVQMPITDLFNYCPNCGAYMRKEAEHDSN